MIEVAEAALGKGEVTSVMAAEGGVVREAAGEAGVEEIVVRRCHPGAVPACRGT